MLLSHLVPRAASCMGNILLSKRTILCRLLPCKEMIGRNIGAPRYVHETINKSRTMQTRETVYRQKDKVNDDYELIYFHSEHRSWSIFLLCLYALDITFIAGLLYIYDTYQPPEDQKKVSLITDMKVPMIRTRIDILLPWGLCMILILLTTVFLKRSVARMYMNKKKPEYLVFYINDPFGNPMVTIPYNCFKPRYTTFIGGRDIIFNANQYTVVLLEEYFKGPYLAKKVLTNCLEEP